MKTLARNHIWWPNLDSVIERRAKSCTACQGNKHLPPKAPSHYWSWPPAPWDRVHIDYAGPFMGKMLFIVVDAHSKRPEVCIMTRTTNTRTISVLREMFARFGLPKQLVRWSYFPTFVAAGIVEQAFGNPMLSLSTAVARFSVRGWIGAAIVVVYLAYRETGEPLRVCACF